MRAPDMVRRVSALGPLLPGAAWEEVEVEEEVVVVVVVEVVVATSTRQSPEPPGVE